MIAIVLFLATASAFEIDELRYLDPGVHPCQDFYQFTCGNFHKYHPRPDHVDIIDNFEILQQELVDTGKLILSSPKSDDDPVAVKKVKAAYRACVDTPLSDQLRVPEFQVINEFRGLPLVSDVEEVEFSWSDVGEMVGRFGVPLLFKFQVAQASESAYYIYITGEDVEEPNLLRPTSQKSFDSIIEKIIIEDAQSIETIRGHSSSDNNLLTFLENLTRNLWNHQDSFRPTDDIVRRDLNDVINFINSLYNGGIIEPGAKILPLENFATLEKLQKWTDEQFGDVGLNWVDYFDRILGRAGIEVDASFPVVTVNVLLYGIINLVRQTPPRTLKNFALLRNLLFLALDSDQPTRKAFEDYFYSKNITTYNREEYCSRKLLDVVDAVGLNYAVAYEYQKYYFNPNKLTEGKEVIQNLRDVYRKKLHETDWIVDKERDEALYKLDNLLLLYGYPEIVEEGGKLDRFYENIKICDWDNYGNSQRIRAYKQALTFSKIDKKSRHFWDKSSFIVNAYYNAINNRITVPLGILNRPFYHENPIVKYSRIGFVLGHEITHSFTIDSPTFAENTRCLVDQYNRYYVDALKSYVNCSSDRCRSEILADNGGIELSWRALSELTDVKPHPNYTVAQLFFIGFGTMFCSSQSDSYLGKLTDYPPDKFRVNGAVSNMAAFGDAFLCPVGSSEMNPARKCAVW